MLLNVIEIMQTDGFIRHMYCQLTILNLTVRLSLTLYELLLDGMGQISANQIQDFSRSWYFCGQMVSDG